jgi:fructose-1,6-bisphosphatase/inositol monophosphatase family enzyme
MNDDLELALRLADAASEIALGFFAREFTTTIKGDGSPVSEADLEVERLLLETLARERPDDSVLSEECGAIGSSSRRWILDPIDGTFNFVAGDPGWGTHIALESDGEIVLGVITRPVLGARWWAARGVGAYRIDSDSPPEGTRLRASRRTELAESRVTVWAQPNPLTERVRERTVWVEPHIDNILGLVEGEVEAVVDAIGEPWDHAPRVILVVEAGGRFRDRDGGRRLDQKLGIYTNGCIDEQLDRLVAGST